MLIARMLIRAVIMYMEPSAAPGAAITNSAALAVLPRGVSPGGCLSCFAIIHTLPGKRNCKMLIFAVFCIFQLFFHLFISFICLKCRATHEILSGRGLNFFPDNAFAGPKPAFFAPPPKKFLLTRCAGSCILLFNSKLNRYDDREKVHPGRFRELPDAARQCEEDGRHWPSSISAETAV